MSYSVTEALEPVRIYASEKADVELSVRSELGYPRSFRVQRVLSPVTWFADVDNNTVLLKVSDREKVTVDRFGFSNAADAAQLAVEFVSFDGSDPSLLKVFASYGRKPKVHELKCWPKFFRPLYRGEKSFEFRKNDRGFEVGDVLDLLEWDPRKVDRFGGIDDPQTKLGGEYTGARERRLVTYVLRAPDAGVPDGHCVMSLERVP